MSSQSGNEGINWRKVLGGLLGGGELQRELDAVKSIKQEVGQQRWYTIKQAAEYLGVDDKEFRKKVVDAGQIPITPLGERGIKIHHVDLANYVINLRQRKGKKEF
jgi:excisionase family DNA binding protein